MINGLKSVCKMPKVLINICAGGHLMVFWLTCRPRQTEQNRQCQCLDGMINGNEKIELVASVNNKTTQQC